jgi:hypothetical protein
MLNETYFEFFINGKIVTIRFPKSKTDSKTMNVVKEMLISAYTTGQTTENVA